MHSQPNYMQECENIDQISDYFIKFFENQFGQNSMKNHQKLQNKILFLTRQLDWLTSDMWYDMVTLCHMCHVIQWHASETGYLYSTLYVQLVTEVLDPQ